MVCVMDVYFLLLKVFVFWVVVGEVLYGYLEVVVGVVDGEVGIVGEEVDDVLVDGEYLGLGLEGGDVVEFFGDGFVNVGVVGFVVGLDGVVGVVVDLDEEVNVVVVVRSKREFGDEGVEVEDVFFFLLKFILVVEDDSGVREVVLGIFL